MKASLPNYRQPPRKVRLLARTLKGQSVNQALANLDFIGRKASGPIKKLINSAVANAKQNENRSAEGLYIKDIRIDKGIVMKRSMARAQGRSTPIRHRTSHIKVELAESIPNSIKKIKPKKTIKK